MAKEGRRTVFSLLLLGIIFSIFSIIKPYWFLIIPAIIFWLFSGFVTYFYRDPERKIPQEKNAILAPADGKVVSIEDVQENDFLHDTVTRISIFMSPLNVHINRIPVSGQVDYVRYKPGKFLAAYRPEASAENEQAAVGITNGTFKILFTQISGVLARRIICNVKEGDQVQQGHRYGMIQLGSRVDVYLAKNVEVKVGINQRVQGGLSILGVIQNGDKN